MVPASLGSLPHARGGVSHHRVPVRHLAVSSPRPWGCFLFLARYALAKLVFPTPVGVFPTANPGSSSLPRLPHARGGVSDESCTCIIYRKSSPRPWGCFSGRRNLVSSCQVFPTPVGVFPRQAASGHQPLSLPHARGGVSTRTTRKPPNTTSSPRPWGCFQNYQRRFCNHPVFPTPVGSPPYTTSVGSVDCDGHGQVNTGQPAPPANE